ncbi:MAG TPA: agmatine deiminase family protein [Polyangiaceae bacterium]|nr:agmatine deiminase family protein [Polyangiaceae bacterium]
MSAAAVKGASALTPRQLGYRWPAEWEPLRAVWLAWPHNADDWPGKFAGIEWVFSEMIHWLTQTQRVGLVVASSAAREHATRCLDLYGVNLERIDWLTADTDRSWTRDSLPTWLVRDRAADPATAAPASDAPALGAVKWLFNGWARYDNHARDEAMGQRVAAARTQQIWTPRQAGDASPRFVLEGGAIDSDGEGTILTTSDCLLGTAFPRNPGLGRADIERVLGDYLAADKVIFLPAGVAGDDTSGHIDDVGRFVAPGKVVLAREDNPNDENYAPLQAAHEYLKGERDARGRRLEVIPLPMPSPRFFDGQRLPASYANFLIVNGRVLVPTFNDPKDRSALGLLAELFPEREVVGVHCLDLVLGLGSIHCSTHHEPLVG